MRGTVSTVVNRQQCLLQEADGEFNRYEREALELTDGTVTLAELTPDGAVLDFDFDGARGRIASRVCTMNDGLW